LTVHSKAGPTNASEGSGSLSQTGVQTSVWNEPIAVSGEDADSCIQKTSFIGEGRFDRAGVTESGSGNVKTPGKPGARNGHETRPASSMREYIEDEKEVIRVAPN
jgi:uncharacterized Zn-binding protein involved in type VI secretion